MSGRWPARLLWAAVALTALCVLIAARMIEPSPRGLGSHLALGLPPCGFLLLFELPCPTCGLTTAFAHLARLELAAALRVHPLGLPLFLATLLSVPLAARAALRAEPLSAVIERHRLDRWALLVALVVLATWAARLGALITR